MLQKDQIFELYLEDYSLPRYMPAAKSYYGTMSEIIDFMIKLEDNAQTATRYKETLDAAEFYDLDNEATHTVAGMTLPIFTPVKELSRLETTMEDVCWEYNTFNRACFSCYASSVELSQFLIETPDSYELCVQANITGLQIHYPGLGWVFPNGAIHGFPGMVSFDENTHRLALAVSQKSYTLDKLDCAMADALNPHYADLSCLVADIIAEG